MAKRDTLRTYSRALKTFEWVHDVKPSKLCKQKLRNMIRKERQQGKTIIRNELKSKNK